MEKIQISLRDGSVVYGDKFDENDYLILKEIFRDWINVFDHCSAIDLILHKGKIGEIYNVSGDCKIDNLSLVKQILQELNLSDDLIEYVSDRRGHDKQYSVSSDKIYIDLGWKPMVDFKEGIRRTVKWYVDNQKWWEPLIERN